jgi:hypothetical protein
MGGSIEKILIQMVKKPNDVSFSDLCKVCDHFFGKPRQNKSSHRIYKTPWKGDPRINIQNEKGKAKAYQVEQVFKAIDKLETQNGNKNN